MPAVCRTEMPTYLGRYPKCYVERSLFARGNHHDIHKARLIGGLHSDEKYIAKLSTTGHCVTCQECQTAVRKNRVAAEVVSSFQAKGGGAFLAVAGYNFARKKRASGPEEFFLIQERQTRKGKFCELMSPVGISRVETGGILEALAHYSYDYSRGQFVMAGMKGVLEGKRGPWKFCTLTSLTFHSLNCQSFGVEDGGEAGMQTFFTNHTCTSLCQDMRQYCTARNFSWDCNGVAEPSAPQLSEEFSNCCYRYNERSVLRPTFALPPPYYEMNNNSVYHVTDFSPRFFQNP